MKKLLLQILLPICLLSASGCATARVPLQTFDITLVRGEYAAAREISTGNAGHNPSHRDLLWTLQAAATERLLQHYAESNTHFDRAEENFNHFDQRLAMGRSAQTAGGILLNDAVLPYTGKNYDRIMVNTYKALNFAALGDQNNARIEFNRALARQTEARRLFARRAQDLRQTLASEKARYYQGSGSIDRSLNNSRLEQILADKYRNLDSFTVYADFVNPFATYIAGLYFWLNGDRYKAVDLLKESYAMSGRHPVVGDDFDRADRGIIPSDEIWVIFENGMAPQRQEIRIDLPILIEEAPIYYVGTAFPNLLPGRQAYPYLTVTADSGSPVSTKSVADMDAVIAAEFEKELDGIVTREVARLALKTYFQYELRRRYGTGGGIVAGIFQAATTRADLRMWSALPSDFQLAHLRMPRNRTVTVSPPNGMGFPIIIPANCRNVIIYIRLVAPGVEPVIDLIKF